MHGKTLAYALLIMFLAAAASAQPRLMWEYRGRGSAYTDLVAEDGVIYYGTSSGMLYGLNATTGKPAMNYTSTAAIRSTPEVRGDRILFGCDNNVVYAVNMTGGRIWTHLAEGRVQSPPAVGNGTVYVGSEGGLLYALRESTGRELWDYDIGDSIESRPLLEDWKLYVGAGSTLYCISRTTGETIWKYSIRGRITSNPALYRDIVYFTASDKRLYAVDKYTGEQLWNHTANGTIYGSPVVSGDSVLYADREGFVYSLSAYFGGVEWTAYVNGSVYHTPMAAEDTVYVGADEDVIALNKSTGDIIWRLNTSGRIRYRPAVYNGVVYVPAGSYIQAFGGAADLTVEEVTVDPAVGVAGGTVKVDVTLSNPGSALAADTPVTVYFDRDTEYVDYVTVAPGGSEVLTYTVNASYGRHILEVIADPEDELIESDEGNNRYGIIYSVAGEWPTLQQNSRRTGYLDFTDSFDVRDRQLRWRCELNSSNRTMDDVMVLWDSANTTAFKIRDWMLNFTCYYYERRGYPVDRVYSNWTCTPYNTTGYSDRNLRSMLNYLNTFNETDYNRTHDKSYFKYPFNVSDFTVSFNCTATGNDEIPLPVAELEWGCDVRSGYQTSPYNLTAAWRCRDDYDSNHSLKDIAGFRGYGSLARMLSSPVKPHLADYTVLWNYSTGGRIASPPILVDLDRLGDGRLETVFGSYDGYVYAIDPEGELLWRAFLVGGVNGVSASDLDGDGIPEVLVASEDGRVTSFKSDGAFMWSYWTRGPVTSTPEALNVDGKTGKEVVFGSFDKNIYAVDYYGGLVWSYTASDYVLSPPAFGDLDSEGGVEVMIGSRDNTLYALNTPPYKLWMYQTNGDVTAAPTVANIYSSRRTDVLVAAADGILYDLYQSSAGTESYQRVCGPEGCVREGVSVTRLRARWEIPLGGELHSSPAVADLADDDGLEMALGSTDGNLYVVNKTGSRLFRYTTDGPIRTSPALADLDRDGSPEIIFGGDDGRIYILNASGVSRWQYKTGGFVRSSPAVADINNDGVLEIAVGSDDGTLYVFGTTTTTTTSTTTSTTLQPETTTTSSTTSSTTTTTTSSTTTSTVPERVFPADEVELGALTILMSLMGYYFFMFIHTPPRWGKPSRLKEM